MHRPCSDVTDNRLTYLPSASNASYSFVFISLCSLRVKNEEFTGQLKCSLYPWVGTVIINTVPPAFELSESFCILALERYTPVTLKWSRWVIILSAHPRFVVRRK